MIVGSIIRGVVIDKAMPLSGSIILNRSIKKFRESKVKDPTIEIFVSVRNKYKHDDSEFMITMLASSKNALGWQYDFIPANVRDGEEDLANKFHTLLKEKIAPEFESKLEKFFLDPDGYTAYERCVEDGEFDAANRVIDDFIYRTASDEDRKKLDKKAEKARKAELRALEERKKNVEVLRKLGLPAKFFAVLL